jgi:hypothetical protein
VVLTAGARAFPEAAQDARCAAPVAIPAGGQTIDCSLDQPPTGESTQFSFDLQVDSPGQTATVQLFRGDALEASLPNAISLGQYEAGLALTGPVWTPYAVGSLQAPLGQLNAGVANKGPNDVSGVTVRIALTGDTGFVPPQLFTHNVPPGLLDELPPGLLPLPADVRDQILKDLLVPLPAGCKVDGWDPPGQGLAWGRILRGGLPQTVVCQADTLKAGQSLAPSLSTAVQPLYFDGDGVIEDATATVTLEVQGNVIATRSLSLLPPPGARS